MTAALRRAWAKDLDVPTLYALLKLRVEVFVVEQARPYPELDGRDLLAETRHFWLEAADGEVICTLRLMEEHAGGQKAFRLGRLCTERSARGQGHTTRLLRAALAEVGDYPCRIDAQIYLTDMYAQHGFVRDGDDFVDDGVPHVPMLKPGSPPPPQAAQRPASSAGEPGSPPPPQAAQRPASSAGEPGTRTAGQ
jgi:ElaA protein